MLHKSLTTENEVFAFDEYFSSEFIVSSTVPLALTWVFHCGVPNDLT
jgi:hypothetical protein